MAEPVAIKYRAFLSYSHADGAWAKWLHKTLENFHIDKDLAGRDTPQGPVPRTLRPIFRDREDFSGGHALADATVAALDASAALLVICSPVAATRPAVNEEVRLFRSRHPGRPVIPVIIEGAWPDNAPPALRHALAADGTITDRPITILGPDLRESGDGKRLGLAKLVAGLTGIGVDDIVRRAARAQKRRVRIRNGIIAALLLLTVAASGSAVYAWHQLKTNEAFLDATLERFTSLTNRAVNSAQAYSLPLPVTLGFLQEAESMLDVMAKYGRPTPKLRQRQIAMLIAFADNYRDLGKIPEWEKRLQEAQRLTAELVRDDAADPEWRFEKMRAHERMGELHLTKGDLAAALADYRAAQEIAKALVQSDPANGRWQRELSVSHEKIGDVQVAQGSLAEALASYRARHAAAERLASAAPGQAGRQRDLSVSYGKIGAVELAQGKLGDALASFRAGLAIAARLADAEPDNAAWQRDLAVSHEKVGDVQAAQGDLAGALASYRAELAIAERLAKADAANTGWQRDLAVSYIKVGDALVKQDNLAEALAAFRASQAIAERLAKTDGRNTLWQRDLSITQHRIGDVLIKQDRFVEALTAYRLNLAIVERLAGSDPDNAVWQRDLSVSHNKVGDVQVAQGRLDDALASFRASLAIRERLVQADPANAEWQRDLAVSHERLGEIYTERKDIDGAKAAFARALAIYNDLRARYPDNTLILVSATVPLIWLGELSGSEGRAQLEEALAILKRLDAAGRLEPRRRQQIAWIEGRLAKLQAPAASR